MNRIILTQTDTTVGFLSQDAQRLERIKIRLGNKPFLKVYADLHSLQRDLRIPIHHRRRLRHAHKTTFIVKNQAFRLVREGEHSRLIKRYAWFYSTSANESGKNYDPNFCKSVCDWIIEDARGLYESSSSKIYTLGHTRLRRIR
ncbi:MAG: hypothetical protein IE884_07060 [Sulfuricurvum sp.]|nr:hypothetical protein [Sulfuricurvum sp.]